MTNYNHNNIMSIVADEGRVIAMEHAERILNIEYSLPENTRTQNGYMKILYQRLRKGFICDMCKKHREGKQVLYIYGDYCCSNPPCEEKLLKKYNLENEEI